MWTRKKLTDRDVKQLLRESLKEPSKSAKELQLGNENLKKVCVRTIQKYLKRIGLNSYRPLKCPLLNKKQKRVRYVYMGTETSRLDY